MQLRPIAIGVDLRDTTWRIARRNFYVRSVTVWIILRVGAWFLIISNKDPDAYISADLRLWDWVFFHIPVTVKNPAKREGLDAVIRVTEGELTEVEVTAELKRLIPGTQDWKVQMVQPNMFRTAFLSTTELQRLVEWGTVHSKKKGVLFHFEEKQSEKPCKVVNSYWVQVMGIPLVYRTFPTIWAVGSLLGSSIDVDMKHTRQFEVGRVQVMILDANLIPSTVEVVIGEEVYLMSFRVEDGNGGLLPETDNDERGFNDDEDDLLGDDDGNDLKGDGPGQLGKTGDRALAAATRGTFTHHSMSGTAQGAALDDESVKVA
jgi:hypothetical protein